jgi:hypothetical protein
LRKNFSALRHQENHGKPNFAAEFKHSQ